MDGEDTATPKSDGDGAAEGPMSPRKQALADASPQGGSPPKPEDQPPGGVISSADYMPPAKRLRANRGPPPDAPITYPGGFVVGTVVW